MSYAIRSVTRPKDLFELECELWNKSGTQKIDALALLDSGAQINVISQRMADKFPLTMVKLWKPLRVTNVDGSPNKKGTVTHKTTQRLSVNGHMETLDLYVTDIHDVGCMVHTSTIALWSRGAQLMQRDCGAEFG